MRAEMETPAPAIKTGALTSYSTAYTFAGSGDGLIYLNLKMMSIKSLIYEKDMPI
jgi:hypothetical protein